ncbi:MAG: hypothetical protein WAW52_10460 [Methanothrix sp.]
MRQLNLARKPAGLISPDGGQAHVPRGQRMDEDAWPGVKAGKCDENALRDLAASWPVASQDYCVASISRRRVSCSCGTTAHGFAHRQRLS